MSIHAPLDTPAQTNMASPSSFDSCRPAKEVAEHKAVNRMISRQHGGAERWNRGTIMEPLRVDVGPQTMPQYWSYGLAHWFGPAYATARG